MKLHCAYAILIRTRVKVVTQVRIQSRWLIFAIFLTGAISLLIGLTYYKSIKSVDLSGYSVNQISLNHGFNQKGFVVNKKIKLDRYTFYNDKNHKDFTVKVKNKTHKVKGMVLVKDDKVETNFGIKMGDPIDKVINKLGEIDLNQVNLKHVSLETDRIIQLKRSELNQVNIESSKANFYITDCLIREGRMKLDKGITHVKNSTLSDTVFLVNRGDISMTDMKSNNDIKASTQRGNINYHFGEKPKNTLLKLHPGHGNKEIKNRYFDKGKVGNSDNILEFYTVDGDIKIE